MFPMSLEVALVLEDSAAPTASQPTLAVEGPVEFSLLSLTRNVPSDITAPRASHLAMSVQAIPVQLLRAAWSAVATAGTLEPMDSLHALNVWKVSNHS